MKFVLHIAELRQLLTVMCIAAYFRSHVGVTTSRFSDDYALSRLGWDRRVQAEDQERMEGVHPRGALGLDGGVRSLGSAPAVSSGGPLSVTPGGWARYEKLSFEGGAALGAVSARVSGAGTLTFTVQNLEGSGGRRIATLSYNVSELPNDPLHPGWALVRTTNVSGSELFTGLQTVYVQFWPAKVPTRTGPAVAARCDTGHCQVEGQVCKPGSPGSISLGYICCGVIGSAAGNWCPDMSIPCGPRSRRPGAGKPPIDYGEGCMNATGTGRHTAPAMVQSDMALDYFVLERK